MHQEAHMKWILRALAFTVMDLAAIFLAIMVGVPLIVTLAVALFLTNLYHCWRHKRSQDYSSVYRPRVNTSRSSA